MTVHPIRSDADYASALERAEALMDADPETAEADELDVLATLIEHYEDEHDPIRSPNPIEAIIYRLDQTGQSPQDLCDILGVHRGRVSELLNGKRRLSLGMIRTLSEELDIPAEILIQTGSGFERTWTSRQLARSRKGGRARRHFAALREASQSEQMQPLPEVVEMHLRAQKDIDPDAVDALSTLFRLAYEQLVDTPNKSGSEETTPADSPDQSHASK
ncbi:MAG: helix-turn-helix domain-containing protein [Bacteroidetes bacterium]|nr:helix-turn-helix domain-containing protein [Bacteroidota bacterium]